MPIARDRNLTLADSLILVAATAIGFSAVKAVHGWYFEEWARWSGDQEWLADHLFGSTGLVLAFWTVALLAIRLRSPRPHLLRLSRQPGFAACLSATSGLCVVGLFMLVIGPHVRNPGPPVIKMNPVALPCIGTAVAAAWIVMAARTFLDRSDWPHDRRALAPCPWYVLGGTGLGDRQSGPGLVRFEGRSSSEYCWRGSPEARPTLQF
jgi:hypothetical protein